MSTVTEYIFPTVRAALICGGRTGGTFLCHCLSNHPQIYCPRGNVLGRIGSLRAVLGASFTQALDVTWGVRGYDAAVAKLGRQAREVVLQHLVTHGGRVIHLVRENHLRVAISTHIYRRVLAGKVAGAAHAFGQVPAITVHVDPRGIVRACNRLTDKQEATTAIIDALGIPVLRLTYAQMTGAEGLEVTEIATLARQHICDFLEVETWPLFTRLKRSTPRPLCQIVRNWNELEQAILSSKYAHYLEDEEVLNAS